jgi:hypothetical protein
VPKFTIEANLYSAHHVSLMLEGLVQCNMDDLRRNPQLPDLYESGVRYVRETDGRNRWQGIIETFALKAGDCEDLCAIRCSQLRLRYAEPRARCDVKFVRAGLWHVRVVRANGQIEDPSKRLGMGQPER